MNKIKLVWVAATAYMDTDLPVLCELQNIYDIHLYIIVPYYEYNFKESFYCNKLSGIKENIHFIYSKGRYDWLNPYYVYRLTKTIKKENAKLYYISNFAMPYGASIYKKLLDVEKCVVPCHNVSVPKGARLEIMARWYTDKWLCAFNNIQVFSKSQHQVLSSLYRSKNILEAPFLLKDYGEPSTTDHFNDDGIVRFLIFGNILPYKRIDLLIEAGNILCERGYMNFSIRIAGYCKDWTPYQQKIHHPEVFDLLIKRIADEDVADLFGDSHYFVQPYQDVAQSGAMVVAFRYGLPSLVSDIIQFEEFVKDGYNGITFESGNAIALADKMESIIINHKINYQILHQNQLDFVDKHYSTSTIIKAYIDYFNSIISSNEKFSKY